MVDHHVVSCEPCKRKKCKCDRKLPCCSQCSSLPSFCKYLHNNKRGIPGGYLSTLEQRLDETEIVLYEALAELRALKSTDYSNRRETSTHISGRQANATKSSRMEEWKALPLKDAQDIQRWWETVGSDNRDVQGRSSNERQYSHNENQYQEDDILSSQQHGTVAGENEIDESNISDSPASHILPFGQANNTRGEDNNFDVAISIQGLPDHHQMQGAQSSWPTTSPRGTAKTAQHRGVSQSGSAELSKSQKLTQEMNHMYY